MKNPWIRTGAVVATVGALGIASAGPAYADEEHRYGGLFGTSPGYTLNATTGPIAADTTGVYPEEDEAGEARAYRLDTLPVTDDVEMVYEQRAWSDTSIDGVARANRIINHSYPILDAATLADKAGADLSDVDDPELVAYTGTQAAIWAATEGVELKQDATGENDAVDAAVLAIAEYLTTGEEQAEPDNSFAVDTSEAETDGKLLGPYTLTGVDDEGYAFVTKPDGHTGGKVVDADGEKLLEIDSGQEFYVAPSKGVEKLTIHAVAKDAPKAGTLMQARSDEGEPSLLLAEDAGYGSVAEATITADGGGADGQLPVTGTSLTGMLTVGAGLLLGGAVLLFVVRRKATATA